MNYIFLDNGFEEIEAITVIDLLRRAQITVSLVSVTADIYVKGAHGVEIKADMFIDDAYSSYQSHGAEMLILPGGATHLENCDKLCQMLQMQNDKNLPIAAICAAPSVLGRLGVLQGKQATCYPGFESWLGSSFVNETIVHSQNIITAKGPGSASQFAFAIIEKLKDGNTAKQVYQIAQY